MVKSYCFSVKFYLRNQWSWHCIKKH